MARNKSENVILNGKKIYYDGYLRSNMDLMKKAASMKFDNVIIIDGMEGLGKTTLAITTAYYLADGNFGLDDIVFTAKQFFEKIKKARPGSSILFDEFIMSGLSTEAFNKIQTEIIKMLTVIRKRRLYIILVIPYFFMLRKYFAIARSKCLIHAFSPDGLTRGYFKFYSYSQKKKLFLKGKSDYQYSTAEPSFYGRFYNHAWSIIDEKEYDKKKEEAISVIGMTESQMTKMGKIQEKLDFFRYMMLNEHQLFKRITEYRNRGYEIMFGTAVSNFTPSKVDELRSWFESTLESNMEKHMETQYSTIKAQAKMQKKEAPSFIEWAEEYKERIREEIYNIRQKVYTKDNEVHT